MISTVNHNDEVSSWDPLGLEWETILKCDSKIL